MDFTIPLSITGVAVVGFIVLRRPLSDLLDRTESLAWIGLKAPHRRDALPAKELNPVPQLEAVAESNSDLQKRLNEAEAQIATLKTEKTATDAQVAALKEELLRMQANIKYTKGQLK